jgi:hypothetical protein
MPQVEFEPTIPASERAKTVYTLYRGGTVNGEVVTEYLKMLWMNLKSKSADSNGWKSCRSQGPES